MEPMLLAHAGGLPETIAIVVPLVLFFLILRAGRNRQVSEDDDHGHPQSEESAPPDEVTPGDDR